MKIAIMYLCTEKYNVLWKDFFESCEQFFLKNSEKHYFVFTDNEKIYQNSECDKIHKIYQEPLKWPDIALQRYRIILTQEKELVCFDYVFFFNANAMFVDYIAEEEFLFKNKFVAVLHPGFINGIDCDDFPYDRNKRSCAYIKYGTGDYYVQAGINGGSTSIFLKYYHELKENVDTDYGNNVVALWYDESHLNQYIIGRDDFVRLDNRYNYSENCGLPINPKIILRDKYKYFDIISIKNSGIKKYIQRALRFLWIASCLILPLNSQGRNKLSELKRGIKKICRKINHKLIKSWIYS